MSTYENKGKLTYVDKNGDLHIMYPVTKKECIQGIEYMDEHVNNTENPHGTYPSQIGAVPIERTINGKPLNDDIVLTPDDIGAPVTDLTLAVSGAAADAKTTGDAIAELSEKISGIQTYVAIDPKNDGNVEFASTLFGGVIWQTFR